MAAAKRRTRAVNAEPSFTHSLARPAELELSSVEYPAWCPTNDPSFNTSISQSSDTSALFKNAGHALKETHRENFESDNG